MATGLRIVVVEDNDELRAATVAALEAEGHRVRGVASAEEYPELTAWENTDLLVVDLNLPGEDGLSLARRVRAAQPRVGLIMVTARALPQEKRQGYESGADIYMAKPVALDELCAAIHALSRRLYPPDREEGYWLDLDTLLLGGPGNQSVTLSVSEGAMMAGFCRAADQRLETWQLLEILQKNRASDPKAALVIALVRLRKKLAQLGAPAPVIQSLRNWGYKLCVPVTLQ
ncbi:response regulator transcription factor [Azospira inquinata]|uniref:Response regulator transcription factor n=1 Tax=Azospira inquinata TaxID=2785627 RepID=A0A975SMU2_9RHOO|nr:response regulator transcription factor [Azospira inquinata]QWT45414.1 response regulator transcription factor [Azospira inquinata]QWT49258.1 response regulator transcription factor [Azospira inquinata]